jgi:hypothetical protein
MGDALFALLTSKEFLEKAVLLILGAVLTGLLVPFVKARLDETSGRRKTLLEAELARQRELIDSQIKLLNQFSDVTWKFLFAAFKVSYTQAWEDEEAQREACGEYGPLSWELLTQIRAIVSPAQRLTSKASQERLMQTYEWLIRLDDQVSTMVDKEVGPEVWVEFHQKNFREAGQVVDEAIESLARDLNLSASQIAVTSPRLTTASVNPS